MRRKSGWRGGIGGKFLALDVKMVFADAAMNLRVLLSLIGCLILVEFLAGWWMSPAPAGLGRPVLSPTAGNGLQSGVEEVRMTRQPGIVAAAMPSLKCSDGMAARLDLSDGTPIHYAYFAWDHDTAGNVLQAFRHLPEECLGAIGMTLVRVHSSRVHDFDGEKVVFDHTEFRDFGGGTVHAFKAVWLSGGGGLMGGDLRSGSQAWRELRMRAAAERFKPAHTRVLQGAVHRIVNPDRAWEIFEANVLGRFGFVQLGGSGM